MENVGEAATVQAGIVGSGHNTFPGETFYIHSHSRLGQLVHLETRLNCVVHFTFYRERYADMTKTKISSVAGNNPLRAR